MAFLVKTDYYSQIRPDHLDKIINSDEGFLYEKELASIEQIFGMIGHIYDTPRIFTETFEYLDSKIYTEGQRVQYSEPDFALVTNYTVGQRVSYEDFIYECIANTSGTEVPTDVSFWSPIVSDNNFYTVKEETAPTAGTKPTDTNFWIFGDDRNAILVMCLVDMVLYHVHARINPRDIPELRFDRYQDCKKFFMSVGSQQFGLNAVKLDTPDSDSENRIFGDSDCLPTNKY